MHATRLLRDTHPQAHDPITGFATFGRKAEFPVGAGENRRHALVVATLCQPVLQTLLRDSGVWAM